MDQDEAETFAALVQEDQEPQDYLPTGRDIFLAIQRLRESVEDQITGINRRLDNMDLEIGVLKSSEKEEEYSKQRGQRKAPAEILPQRRQPLQSSTPFKDFKKEAPTTTHVFEGRKRKNQSTFQ